ncbi:MAG: hypothetical protein DBX47_04760 [Clostridiales bacterium]|nr:MAG: hypothetical protein DBX47_04760 [Clostridiales bacterium]
MKVLSSAIIYENPIPHLRSRQSKFAFPVELDNGKILCTHVIGEAFESADETAYICESTDGGLSWSQSRQMFDKSNEKVLVTDNAKLAYLGGENLVGIGYKFERPDRDLPPCNAETGGLLDDCVFITRSFDGGKTWQPHESVPNAWGPHTEASAPITVLKNGDWISPITGFPAWDGKMTSRVCGRMLHSTDEGKTWDDDTVCFDFPGDSVICYEQRVCQLESGRVVAIAWNEDIKTGDRMNNHVAISDDNARTFSAPIDTGIRGQASSVCAIGGEKLLALHAIRRDTDEPGIYGYIVNLENGKWEIEEEKILWQPNTPVLRNTKLAEIFAFLKFGQPGAIKLKNGNILMTHWFAEDGQYKTMSTLIEL